MIEDSDLKLNKFYIAMVTDKDLGALCGQIIKVKFTGIVFRNSKYLTPEPEVNEVESDNNKVSRQKLFETKKVNPIDAVFYLSQLKIYREAGPNE